MHEDDTPELQQVARILKDLGVSLKSSAILSILNVVKMLHGT